MSLINIPKFKEIEDKREHFNIGGKKMKKKEQKQISRKDFLKGVGASVAGVAVAGSMGGLLTACGGASASVDTSSIEAAEWPLKYVELDPDKVSARAYDAYKNKGG